MPSDERADTWLRPFWPTIRFPGVVRYPFSGDLGGFHFEPSTRWEAPSLYRGNDAVEQRVYREVASPGKQLGRLTDAVLALANTLVSSADGKIDPPEVAALRKIAAQIEEIKGSVADNTEQVARESLEKLAQSDPVRLRKVLDDYPG